MKTCFKCGVEKPLDEFYAHPYMKDKHLNKCKECARRDVQQNYAAKREKYAAYYKQRQQTAERRRACVEHMRRSRLRYPEKYQARRKLGDALRSGKIKKGVCVVCGTDQDIQAHHIDYNKPLDVVWYCGKHHRIVAHGKQA